MSCKTSTYCCSREASEPDSGGCDRSEGAEEHVGDLEAMSRPSKTSPAKQMTAASQTSARKKRRDVTGQSADDVARAVGDPGASSAGGEVSASSPAGDPRADRNM